MHHFYILKLSWTILKTWVHSFTRILYIGVHRTSSCSKYGIHSVGTDGWGLKLGVGSRKSCVNRVEIWETVVQVNCKYCSHFPPGSLPDLCGSPWMWKLRHHQCPCPDPWEPNPKHTVRREPAWMRYHPWAAGRQLQHCAQLWQRWWGLVSGRHRRAAGGGEGAQGGNNGQNTYSPGASSIFQTRKHTLRQAEARVQMRGVGSIGHERAKLWTALFWSRFR